MPNKLAAPLLGYIRGLPERERGPLVLCYLEGMTQDEAARRLAWLDSVQVKWFAWAAEYPETSIYGKEAARPDHKPLTPKSRDVAGPLGNLDVASRRFGILKAADRQISEQILKVYGTKLVCPHMLP